MVQLQLRVGFTCTVLVQLPNSSGTYQFGIANLAMQDPELCRRVIKGVADSESPTHAVIHIAQYLRAGAGPALPVPDQLGIPSEACHAGRPPALAPQGLPPALAIAIRHMLALPPDALAGHTSKAAGAGTLRLGVPARNSIRVRSEHSDFAVQGRTAYCKCTASFLETQTHPWPTMGYCKSSTMQYGPLYCIVLQSVSRDAGCTHRFLLQSYLPPMPVSSLHGLSILFLFAIVIIYILDVLSPNSITFGISVIYAERSSCLCFIFRQLINMISNE